MDEQHIVETLIQAGTPGGLVVGLGWLIKTWLARIEQRLANLEGKHEKNQEKDGQLELDVRDLGRRVTMLEGSKAR